MSAKYHNQILQVALKFDLAGTNTVFYQEPMSRSLHIHCILESTYARKFLLLELLLDNEFILIYSLLTYIVIVMSAWEWIYSVGHSKQCARIQKPAAF